jgi:hypothetical protein
MLSEVLGKLQRLRQQAKQPTNGIDTKAMVSGTSGASRLRLLGVVYLFCSSLCLQYDITRSLRLKSCPRNQ